MTIFAWRVNNNVAKKERKTRVNLTLDMDKFSLRYSKRAKPPSLWISDSIHAALRSLNSLFWLHSFL